MRWSSISNRYPLMDTSGHAPMWAVLPPAGAPAVNILLRRSLSAVRHQLDAKALAAIDEFLRQTEQAAVWQQEWTAERPGAAFAGENAQAASAKAEALSSQELSAEEAALKLNITPTRVRQLCQADELVARKVAGSWLIDPMSVDLRVTGRAA